MDSCREMNSLKAKPFPLGIPILGPRGNTPLLPSPPDSLCILPSPHTPQEPPRCPLHFLIPEGGEEWVEGGCDYSVEKRNELASPLVVVVRGLQVGVDG